MKLSIELLKLYSPEQVNLIEDALYHERKQKLEDVKFWAERSNKRKNPAFEIRCYREELDARGELAQLDRICLDCGFYSSLKFYNRSHKIEF